MEDKTEEKIFKTNEQENLEKITPITEDSFKSAKKHFVIYAQQKLWKKRKQN